MVKPASKVLLVTALVLIGVGALSGGRAPFRVAAQEVVTVPQSSKACVMCHKSISPGIVEQWNHSKHAQVGTGCAECHGTEHNSVSTVDKAKLPSPKDCGNCHPQQAEQFAKGKHSLGWVAMTAIPMWANLPASVSAKGCGGCHSVGKPHADGSFGKCDSCHTRHKFSREEAREPEACETCHMGEDHAQYEMWESSKHGIIYRTEGRTGRAPICQTCHMPDGDHAVMTGWGFLALRLPVPDEKWTQDTLTIVKALGPWGTDEAGMGQRVEAIKALKLARLTQEEFDERWNKMLNTCARCHAKGWAKEQLDHSQNIIRDTAAMLAEAVKIVQGLYDDGLLPKSPDGPKKPDMLLFYDNPTPIEQELYQMFLFHRQKAYQGAVHNNPDYMHWYGWARMKTSLAKIKAMAEEMRSRR